MAKIYAYLIGKKDKRWRIATGVGKNKIILSNHRFRKKSSALAFIKKIKRLKKW